MARTSGVPFEIITVLEATLWCLKNTNAGEPLPLEEAAKKFELNIFESDAMPAVIGSMQPFIGGAVAAWTKPL